MATLMLDKSESLNNCEDHGKKVTLSFEVKSYFRRKIHIGYK